jgi:drug/metabolite transporter (DMT)-like permease
MIFMLVNVAFWGAALPISKYAVDNTSPFLFLLYRFSLASLLSIPIIFYYWPKIRARFAVIRTIFILELLGTTIALGSLYLGLQLTSALEASLLVTTLPVFITLGGLLFFQEKILRWEWLGLFIALAGSILLVIEPLLSGFSDQTESSLLGNALILMSNITTAAYFLFAKKHYAKLPKFFVTSISFWVGAVSFLLFAGLHIGFADLGTAIFQDLNSPLVLWPSVYMAVFGSIIGLTVYILGQNLIEASEASLYSYLQPLIYIPLAYFMHGDQLHPAMGVAIILVIIGVFVGEKRWR